MTMQKTVLAVLAAVLMLSMSAPAKAQSGLFDAIGKEHTKEGSPERKLLQGLGTIMRSTQGLDYKSELALGESLALKGFERYGMPVEDKHVRRFVNLMGNALAMNSNRPDIPYHFVVVKSPLKNAFSCPGGIIILSSGLVKSLMTEGQLANVLAHEIAHVAQKHAVKTIQQGQLLQGLSQMTAAGMQGEEGRKFQKAVSNMATTLFDTGLSHSMEFEADRLGMQTAYRTGYSPHAMIEVLRILEERQKGSTVKGSWYGTHPPLDQRIAKLNGELKAYPDWKELRNSTGRLNWYKERIP
ncbi:M48 family metalloprotease [Salidesulfovibrio brasiliensis]